MFDWLINWLFPTRPEYKPNIDAKVLLSNGHIYDNVVAGVSFANEEFGGNVRLPTVEELQYLARNNLVDGDFTDAWCVDRYNDAYAYVVYADGSRKKCHKSEFHQLVVVRDL